MNLLFFTEKTIHRKLLENELKKQAEKISGKILDIGSKDARYIHWFSGEVISIDVLPNLEKGVAQGDIYNLSFKGQTFDGVLSTEVFEYLADPLKAVSEIFRVLKPEGTLILSAPLVYRVHKDLVRYTQEAWEKLLKDFEIRQFIYIGNFYTIILDILRDKLTKISNRFFRYFFYLPFFILTLFIPLSLKFSKDKNFVSGYLILAKK